MRVLIDCNVIVSAALGSRTCLQALAEALSGHTVLVTAEIVSEYRRVAAYPKFSDAARARLSTLVGEIVALAETVPDGGASPTEAMADADDLIHVAAAGAGAADAIVTGNLRHFTQASYGGARVLSVRAFLDETEAPR